MTNKQMNLVQAVNALEDLVPQDIRDKYGQVASIPLYRGKTEEITTLMDTDVEVKIEYGIADRVKNIFTKKKLPKTCIKTQKVPVIQEKQIVESITLPQNNVEKSSLMLEHYLGAITHSEENLKEVYSKYMVLKEAASVIRKHNYDSAQLAELPKRILEMKEELTNITSEILEMQDDYRTIEEQIKDISEPKDMTPHILRQKKTNESINSLRQKKERKEECIAYEQKRLERISLDHPHDETSLALLQETAHFDPEKLYAVMERYIDDAVRKIKSKYVLKPDDENFKLTKELVNNGYSVRRGVVTGSASCFCKSCNRFEPADMHRTEYHKFSDKAVMPFTPTKTGRETKSFMVHGSWVRETFYEPSMEFKVATRDALLTDAIYSAIERTMNTHIEYYSDISGAFETRRLYLNTGETSKE